MNLDVLAAYAVSTATLSAIFVQLIKQIFIDPNFPASAQRDAVLRALTYLFNFGLLMLVVVTHGAFEYQLLFEYILLAFGQTLVSHTTFKVLSSGTPSGTSEGGGSDTSPTDGSNAGAS